MAKTMRMLVVSCLLVTIVQAPASAQAGHEFVPGEPPLPKYEVTDDGTLIYEGDYAIRCEDLVGLVAAAGGPQTFEGITEEPLTREAARLCKEAGFYGPGDSLERRHFVHRLGLVERSRWRTGRRAA